MLRAGRVHRCQRAPPASPFASGVTPGRLGCLWTSARAHLHALNNSFSYVATLPTCQAPVVKPHAVKHEVRAHAQLWAAQRPPGRPYPSPPPTAPPSPTKPPLQPHLVPM